MQRGLMTERQHDKILAQLNVNGKGFEDGNRGEKGKKNKLNGPQTPIQKELKKVYGV